jgi:hypothetical protein
VNIAEGDALSGRSCADDSAHSQEVERQSCSWEVRVIAVVAVDGWGHAALRREQLDDIDVEPILQEMEAWQRPKWKDVADRSTTYKNYWDHWGALVVNDV